MKTKTPKCDSFGKSGSALILVLGALVLISLLVVAFFTSVTRELSASKTYASGFSARSYGDAAVNIVIGQLRAATTKDDATQTWVSQPGLIRRYDNAGKLTEAYKLYSSDNMVQSDFAPLTGGIPTDVPAWTSSDSAENLPWNKEPGVYTDLNSPIVVNDEPRYPILNPGGLHAATKIQGFEVNGAYALPDTKDWDKNGDTSEIAQIPMPVRWLYILSDGSVASATSEGTKTVRLTLADGSAPAANNPAVARVAFWTDDDTCRLNINTASEGNFWTTHLAAAGDDNLSYGQINKNEFQRYPGHPATTSLSPVFSSLTTDEKDMANFIYALTPRVSGRGSQSGARYLSATRPIVLDNDRLYASIDELLFLPTINGGDQKRYRTTSANMTLLKQNELDWKYTGTGNSSMTGTPYAFKSAISLEPERLDMMNFFLTTHSNAPEVNLMGKPRISLWPIDTRADRLSIYDRLISFCSTVNTKQYYFQRQNPNSQTEDYASIGRNQEIYGYLSALTNVNIPGFGGNFGTKYPADRLQILTEIFDWIRTVNLAYRDKTGTVKPYAWTPNTQANGTVKPPGEPGSGQVLPIKIGTTMGTGRFPTLSKAALSIVRESEDDTSTPGTTKARYRVLLLMETYVPMLGFAGYIPNYELKVEGLANGFDFVADTPATSATPKILPVSINDGTILVTVPANIEPFTGRAWGGSQGFNNLFAYSDSSTGYSLTPRTLGSANKTSGYPFVSSVMEVSYPTADKLKIRVGLKPRTTGALQVTINDVTGSQITTDSLSFPTFGPYSGAFLSAASSALSPVLQTRVDEMVTAYKVSTGGMENSTNGNSGKGLLSPADMIRGVELSHGDLRLLAMQGTNAKNTFVKHKDYNSSSFPQAHNLTRACGNATPSSAQYFDGTAIASKDLTRGLFIAVNASIKKTIFTGTALSFVPMAPSNMTVVTAPGDFTTGISSECDGPHIIKADEGNSSFSGMNWGMSVQIPYQNQLFPYDDRLSDAFSPCRQVASAVQLGTLPSMPSTTPWQTLLFRPDIAGTHAGGIGTHDSLLLDLFWMPVVDPYAISEPLSTAGKVNLNYQIVPFTYIKRATALPGVMKSTQVMAMPKEFANEYKWSGYTVDLSKGRYPVSFLYDVDMDKTLMFFEERFNSANKDNNIFKSASEICTIPLAPKHTGSNPVSTGHPDNTAPSASLVATTDIYSATSAADLRTRIQSFWNANTLTGDNARETPYNNIYPRLTTQSNSYTVYVRVQALQVRTDAPAGTFSDAKDVINGEYRCSYEVERFIDASDTKLPDFGNSANITKTLYPYYQFRVKNAKQFLP
ncbi:MAG: Verru_Chthon cassette protein A [Candidatus Methylacidiphilales bacterium]|nr:Verru_Chthon cassette protein A [Candidatus Methylacidiphilales bacterium]